MLWVIEMPERRRNRRIHNDKNVAKEISITEDRGRKAIGRKEHHINNLGTIGVSLLFVCAIIVLFAGIWTPYLLILGGGLLVVAVSFLLFMMIYENLISIKNYLRSIDEKLDQD